MKLKLSSFSLKALFITGLFFFFSTISAQTTIAVWNFEPFTGADTNPTPNIGSGTSSIVNAGGGTIGSVGNYQATGMTGALGCGTQNGSGAGAWALNPFDPGSIKESNGVQFNGSTLTYQNIMLTWDQRFSDTSPNTVRLQYTIDGSTWTNFIMSGSNTTLCAGSINANGCFENNAGDVYRRVSVDLSGINTINNNANFRVRLVAAHYQSTGQFRQSVNPLLVAGINGTWRFDNVIFTGQPFSAVMTGTTGICSGSTNIYVTMTGGTSPYNLTYTDGFTNTVINGYTSGTAIAVSPSSTKTYSIVSVTDSGSPILTLASSGSAVVTVYTTFNAGAINTTGQTICSGGDPSIIGSIATASGGNTTYTYQWQANGAPITSATSSTYDPPSGLTVSTTYTRWVKDGLCNTTYTQSTGSWLVTVNALPTATFTAQPGATACANSSVTYITQTGQSNYTWVASGTAGTNYTFVSGGSSTDNTYVIKWLTSGGTVSVNYTNTNGCSASTPTSSTAITTLYTAFTAGTISSNGQLVCAGGTTAMTTIVSTTPASGGNAGLTYQWQANGVTILGATSATYKPPSAPLVTTVYTRWANDGTCNTTPVQSSGSWTVTTTPAPIITVAPSPTTQTVCQGTAFTPLSVTATGTVLNYQWYSSTGNTNYSQLTPILIPATGAPAAVVPTGSGGKNPSFTPTSSTAGTFYYFVRVTSTGCTTAYSDYTAAYTVIASSVTPTIASTFAISSLCTSTSVQTATLNYTATTGSPSSYSIDWNAAANTAGIANQGSTSLSFSSGAGTITGIAIPANLAPNQYTGSLTVTNACGNSVSNTITINVGKQWNGTTSTDWGAAANWTPNGVPTSSDCIVIPSGTTNSPVITATSFANNLTINSGASLTVNAGVALEVQDFVKTDGTLTLNNNSSLVQVNNVTNSGSGSMVYKRDVGTVPNPLHGYDYVYWSSPVASQSIDNLYSTPSMGYKYYWDTLVNNNNGTGGNTCQGNWAVASGNMSIGKGYIVRASNSYGWTGTLTGVFTGIPNNGTLPVPIARGLYQGDGYSGVNGVAIDKTEDNLNLIGNPYPSAIKAIDFLTANTTIEGNVCLWTHTSSPESSVNPFYSTLTYTTNYATTDYITYNGSGPSSQNGFNGLIAAGQGFFVSMVDGPADATKAVTFTNSMRSKGYDNSQFFKTGPMLATSENDKHRIWIDLIDATNYFSRALVAYCEGATHQKDRIFDAYTRVADATILYSLIGSESQIIQGRGLPFDENDQVPLGYHAQTAGTFTIAIAAVDGLFGQGQSIYLEDKLLHITFNLRQAPYVFSTEQGTFNDRFVLRYTDTSLSNSDFSALSASFVVFKSHDVITIQSDATQIGEVVVYDVQGRIINDFKNLTTSEFQFSAPSAQQVLVLKIITKDNLSFYRKILN